MAIPNVHLTVSEHCLLFVNGDLDLN